MSDERRVVTVIFADVTGSTALGESLDPEDLRALLGRYYAIAKDVVAAHGGTTEKFIGDAVMAVFGLRRAHGDDAVRAISAALELRDRVRSDPRLGERMPIRLGVNTGDVVASRGEGGDDFLVTGDAVNVAARLQQAAAPWSILAGERAVRAAHGHFRFAAAQSIEAKGKSQALAAREVTGRAGTASNRIPIFGRDNDLAQLELVARRAFDERRPFMVSILAPAGTGKTRLLEEFIARLPNLDLGARVAVAQCLPYGQRLTYWPLRSVLYRIVGIDEDAPPEEVRRAIADWMSSAEVEDVTVGDLLASTVGAADIETSDRTTLFAAWRSFIEAASRQAPLVVAIEDLHWSSDTLLDLFEFVLQPRGDTRALLVAIARPELLDRRPGWGGGRRNHVSISLEPLDDQSTARLVETLAEGASPQLVEAIVARAEGNPFFAGEIVGALLESLESFSDPVAIEAALARLPDTVQATVLARLDALPDAEREVLRVGSVFGRSFRPSGIAALLPQSSDADLAAMCEDLVDRDIIRPSGADAYAFRHILIREVAYSTLPRSARAHLHAAAARWLEGHAAGREEALAELIALHYREAATLGAALELADADQLRDSARTWLVRAAQIAQAAAANIEARQHVRAALEFARTQDLPELYELLGNVEIEGGDITDAYLTALEHVRREGRGPDMELRVLANVLMVHTRAQGSVAKRPSDEQMAAWRAEARALLDKATDPTSRALFLISEGFQPFWTSAGGVELDDATIDAAARDAQAGLALAQAAGDLNLQSAALDALGSIAQERADWDLALGHAQQRIAMGTNLVLFEQIDAHAVATWSAYNGGRLADAERLSGAGLRIFQPGQGPDWALHLVAWRALTMLTVGEWDEAERAIELAYRLWLEVGRTAAGYSTRGFVAGLIIARARHDDERARRWAEATDEIGQHFENRRVRLGAIARADLPGLAGEFVANDLDPGPALDVRMSSLSIISDARISLPLDVLERQRADPTAAATPILRAEIERAIGLSTGDPRPLTVAHEIFEAIGAKPYAARTSAEVAIITGDRARLDAALAYLESIRDELQVERYLKAAQRGGGGTPAD